MKNKRCEECIQCDECAEKEAKAARQKWPKKLQQWVAAVEKEDWDFDEDTILAKYLENQNRFSFCPFGTNTPLIAGRETNRENEWSSNSFGFYKSVFKRYVCFQHSRKQAKISDPCENL